MNRIKNLQTKADLLRQMNVFPQKSKVLFYTENKTKDAT